MIASMGTIDKLAVVTRVFLETTRHTLNKKAFAGIVAP